MREQDVSAYASIIEECNWLLTTVPTSWDNIT
jgi:hypothetical protein